MPPEVGKTGEAGAPHVSQAPLHMDQPKSAEIDKKPAPDQKSVPNTEKAPPDPKAAAKSAQGSKQNAVDRQHQQKARAQDMQRNLQKQVSQPKGESFYQTAKNAAEFVAVKLPAAAKAAAQEAAEIGASGIREQGVQKLHQRTYPQDMLPGELHEVEKITPGSDNKINGRERVEDTGVGDVASKRYHQEQHRTATQYGLEDRLKELNQHKELTPFEKGLVSEWDPQKKGKGDKEPITALSPIMGLDSTGTKGPTEVQAYKVQRGLETSYHDRNGNVIEAETARHKIMKLDRREYPQDKVRGELHKAENITPGSTNEIKTKNTVDINWQDIKGSIHPKQNSKLTQSGLADRLKDLNQAKDLTPFEKGLVSEWDPQMKRKGEKGPITGLTPILATDATGKKVSSEVQAYAVVRGFNETYYDRNGNVLMERVVRGHGQAIPTDGPMDYLSLAHAGTKLAVNVGRRIVEKVVAREGASITQIANTFERQGAKAEASGARTAEQRTATQQQVAKPREQWEDINTANKGKQPPATKGGSNAGDAMESPDNAGKLNKSSNPPNDVKDLSENKNTNVASPPPPPKPPAGSPGGRGPIGENTVVSHPPPMPRPAPKVAPNANAPGRHGMAPDSQMPVGKNIVAGKGKTLPGSLRRPGGPFDPRRPQVPERPLPKNFPKGSGTALTPEQVRQAHDARKVGWSMTREEHARQWKQANPTSTEPPPVSFTTRDGRVQVDEARWIESGQPALWGNRAGDQVSSPPPPPSNNE